MNSILKRKTILLVEDSMINAIPVINILKESGYETIHAPTGEEAVALFEAGDRFDLILMDVELGDGITGTTAAKKILQICRPHVIFLTSYSSDEVKNLMGNDINYGYISKILCSPKVIRKTIEIFFRSRYNQEIIQNIIFSSAPDFTLCFND